MDIEIYSKENCGQCNAAKKMIESKCMDYEELILGKDVTPNDLFDRIGNPVRSVPQVFVDGEYVGGYNEFTNFMIGKEGKCTADT